MTYKVSIALCGRFVTRVVSLIAFAFSGGCLRLQPGNIDDDKASTVTAIAQLHARLNASKFDEIYRSTSEGYRNSQKLDASAKTMTQVRNQFGDFQKATRTELNVIITSPVQIRAVYNSSFEKGPATELFVFVKEDRPRLAHYEIYPGTITPSTP